MKNSYEIVGDKVHITLKNRYNYPNKIAIIDLADLELVSSIPGNWTSSKVRYQNKWYVITTQSLGSGFRKATHLHRLIMNTPKHLLVDHIDNNGLNNCRSNLRNVTPSENCKYSNVPKFWTHDPAAWSKWRQENNY